jgi:hypothetical protein
MNNINVYIVLLLLRRISKIFSIFMSEMFIYLKTTLSRFCLHVLQPRTQGIYPGNEVARTVPLYNEYAVKIISAGAPVAM